MGAGFSQPEIGPKAKGAPRRRDEEGLLNLKSNEEAYEVVLAGIEGVAASRDGRAALVLTPRQRVLREGAYVFKIRQVEEPDEIKFTRPKEVPIISTRTVAEATGTLEEFDDALEARSSLW
jgi:hypothetical protein